MSKSWNEMNLLEKSTTLIAIVAMIVGYSLMFYAAVVAVSLWTYEHTKAITTFIRGLCNFIKKIISHLTINSKYDD